MKRYNFYFCLMICFLAGMTYAVTDTLYSLTMFNKQDVAKYWLIKKIAKKHNGRKVLNEKINPLLAGLKQNCIVKNSLLCQMNIKIIAYCRIDQKSPIYGCYFAFSDVLSYLPHPRKSLLAARKELSHEDKGRWLDRFIEQSLGDEEELEKEIQRLENVLGESLRHVLN